MSEIPKTIREFDPDDRPQEKAEQLGIHTLSLSELWAVILRSGQPGVPITQLTQSLMHQNEGKLKVLERRSRKELMQIPGIGPVKAIQIEAVLEIMRRYNREKLNERVRIRSALDIFNFMVGLAGHLDYEKIWIIHLTRGNMVIDFTEVSSGGTTGTVFDLKKIVKESILTPGCESIIMCHNHPSGTLRPSVQDDNITRSLKEACKFLDLKFLDHVIVTRDGFYSYQDEGRL